MAEEAAEAVLRDFETVIWLTLVFGLLGAAAWRFFSSALGGKKPDCRDHPHHGIPTSHFSGADLVVLPMVLVKYSFALIMLAALILSLPSRFFTWLGLAPGEESGGTESGSSADEAVVATPQLILMDVILGLVLVALVLVMIQWVAGADPGKVFGLRRQKGWRLPVWIVTGAVISIPIVFVMRVMSDYGVNLVFGESLGDQTAVQSLREAKEEPLMRIFLIGNACLVAPIVEEVIFRGYLYGVLKRFTGPMFAGFIGASLFAVAHNNLPVLIPLWGFGLLLTLAYEASRCLWVPIGIHSVFNIFQIVLMLKGGG